MAAAAPRLPFVRFRTAAFLRAREARAYLADRKGPGAAAGKKNVLIFGQGRSGTTLFETLMCSTGHFTGHHEVLNTVTREVVWPTAYVRGLGHRRPRENVILHVKPEHLGRARRRPMDAADFLRTICADGWTIVQIQRRNVLRLMISHRIAKARGGVHKTDYTAEAVALTLPPEKFARDYEKLLGWQTDEDRLMAQFPHIKLTYEDHLERPETHQSAVNMVLDALALDRRPASTPLKKINTFAPETLLSNLSELRAAFEARG